MTLKNVSEIKPLHNYDLAASENAYQGETACLKYEYINAHRQLRQEINKIANDPSEIPALERLEMSDKYLYSDKILGYYFVIKNIDGECIFSALYPTKEEAIETRNNFLIFLNKTESSLPKITI